MRKSLSFFFVILSVLMIGCNSKENKNTVEASGTLEATNMVVSAQVAGKLKDIKISEGSTVNSNDTLIIIDDEQYKLQLERAKAGYQLAQAQLELLQNGARSEDIAQISEVKKQAEVNLTQAETDFKRIENLYKSNSITQKQFEDAQNKVTLAKAQFAAADENLKKIRNISRPEEIKQASARVADAKVNIDLLSSTLNYCYVLAPSKGTIVKKFVEKGEIVSPLSSLVKISDLSKMKLVIYVPETELGKIKLNQFADITIDSFKDKSFKGRISFISPEAEFTPKNIQTKDERTKLVYAVKIEIDNPEMILKDGMPADARINLAQLFYNRYK